MVPEGWAELRLGEVARITSGATPKVGTPRYYDSGSIPFLKIQDLTVSDSLRVDCAEEQITHAALSETSAKLYPAGTVLVTMYGTIGTVRITSRPMAANQAIAAFLDLRSVDPVFLACLLGYHQPQLESLALQTTQANISGRVLKSYPAVFPPLPEQREIAAILCRVDDAIAATRKVIEQTKRVKQGLLQIFMTRGIGHTRFKKTEIGEIPEDWEAVKVEDVATRGSGHTPSKQYQEYWDGDIKWVSLSDSDALDQVYLSTTRKTITPEGIANSSAVVHPAGTVFVSRDASVGRSAIAACDLAVSQHFIAWQCGDRLNNHFLYYFLQHHKPQFERIAVGSTIKTIGLGYFKDLRIPLPPTAEQDRIVEVLLGHDRAVWAQESTSEELEVLKRGLMQDLLTGRVRVQPD